jgi:uncharacterized membrane protein YqhA
MEKLLLSTRYLINLAVLAALLGAAAILIYGTLVTLHVIGLMFLERFFTVATSKAVAIGFIEVIDLLFLGVVLYITALGLYHLFIEPTANLPRWLKIEEFEELKVILVSLVGVLLAVNFTGQVVEWEGGGELLSLGIAVGLVIAAIALVLYTRAYKQTHQLPEISTAEHFPEN